MGLRFWRNGDKGGFVKSVIDSNFKLLGKNLSKTVLCLSTAEREKLNSDYLSDGLRIYDTTLNCWVEYKNLAWVVCETDSQGVSIEFLSNDWNNGEIDVPFSKHGVSSPIVQMFILADSTYELVNGGIIVYNNNNITLQSDFPFDGKVVIK